MGFLNDQKPTQPPVAPQPDETSEPKDLGDENNPSPSQLKREEKARAKALRQREKEIAKAEKKLSREKAIINARAAFQKRRVEKHRLEEEEEALRLILSLSDNVEAFNPETIGMDPDLYKRAVALYRRKAKAEKDKKIQAYKKAKARREGKKFAGPGAGKANSIKFLHFLNLSEKLKTECEEEFPPVKLAIHAFVAFAIIALAGHFIFSLMIPFILICCVVYFFCAPSLIYFARRKKYEAVRFRNCSRYIEQMIYSFKRRQSLLTALVETRLVMDGSIGEAIDYAIDVLRHRAGEDDIYPIALSRIEAFFPSSRVKNLHKFLVDVERDGGRHESTMDILLEDVREWDIRTNQFQQNQAVKGISLIVSIAMSVGVCWFMNNILPDELGGNIAGNLIYQLATTLMLIVMFLMYLFGNRKLTRSWITDTTSTDEARVAADQKAIEDYFDDPRGKIKPVLAIIRMQTEIEKAFPRWVHHFALLSSSVPVPVALSASAETAPLAIKPELDKMVRGINKNPTAIEPYLDFCRHYDMPQIHSMMMMIYSLSEYGLIDADQQVLSLVKRNNTLQANAEKIQNDEQLARFSLYTIIPMLVGSLVMMVDVVLMILNMVQNIL